VFSALADPTRRALVARLEQEESLTVSELAQPFPVSLPAIMKHLDVLSDAGLIARSKSGRTVNCQLTAATMKSAMEWLHRYERFWSAGLDRLSAILEEDEAMSTQTATKPSLTIKRRFNAPPVKVYAAWTNPEMIARWFGPHGVERVEAETDLRVGGQYHITMHVPGDQHDVLGVYREIVPNEKLVFTWAWKSTPEREIARDGHIQAGRHRHHDDPAARKVLRRGRSRPSQHRMDRCNRQARKTAA